MTYEEIMLLQLRQIEAEQDKRIAAVAGSRDRARQFIAAQPWWQREGLQRGLDMAMQGRAEAGGALVQMGGLDFICGLAEAGAPPTSLRCAIETALLERYSELPSFIAANGGRAAFASWCRKAQFVVSEALPETLTIYRGTMGISPAVAASGLHWADTFEKACFYACRFADRHMTGVIVVKAEVHRDEIVAFLEALGEHEVIPADVPAHFEVVADHELILSAGHRALLRYRDQIAQGHPFIATRGIAERAAMVTRDRMTAAGIAPGTAIVHAFDRASINQPSGLILQPLPA